MTVNVDRLYSITQLLQIRVSAYRLEDTQARASTIVRVFVTRNANAPAFRHGNLEYTISEDQLLGIKFGQVNATDADSVSKN